MIEWFARNPVAANLLMVTIIVAGVVSASRSIPLEVFPSFDIQSVSVTTVYRGATPSSVEQAITTRVEQAIFDLEGVKQVNARSAESVSTVIAEIDDGYDKRLVLNDIKLRIDALNTLPLDAEKPVVALSSFNPGVIQVAVRGDVDYKTLRATADRVREDLLSNPNITLVNLMGTMPYEISVEIEPATLDRYGLTLSQVARAISAGSVDVSAGNVKTIGGEILLRADGQAYDAAEFARIPVVTKLGADPVRLGDIASVEDGFEEQPLITRFNSQPAVMMDVLRSGDQSAIVIADYVRDYIDQFNARSSNGVQLNFWDDDSQIVRARLATLINSGIYGGILVLLVLSLFLRPAIAFWVFLGVPVSFMGAFIFMPFVGGTFNIISLFAFITVLGIVVDDAIVTGENIYTKTREGLPPLEASIVGTKEIAVPVTFGILTTIVAFFPMSELGENRTGYLAAQIPMVVIPVLLFSLIESKLVLPSHLSHVRPRKEGGELNFLSRMQRRVSRGFEQSVISYYRPALQACLANKAITLATLLAVSGIILAWATSGHLKFTFFPRVESEEIRFNLTMPDTTGFSTTQKNIQQISDVVAELQEKYRDPETGVSVIRHTYSTIGSVGRTVKPSIGQVRAELIGPDERHVDIKASELAREIRQRVGEFPGQESLSVRAELGRGGEPIDVELSGSDPAAMRALGMQVREQLRQYPHVFDIQDNFSGGKEELNIDLKPRAHALGLSLADIAGQVRDSVFGAEAQRVQRGREEVRVMVRLPKSHRSSMDDLLRMNIYVPPSNDPIPLADLATVTPATSPTTLYRLNRNAIVNITADLDKERTNVPAIIRDLRSFLEEATRDQPDLRFTFKGESEEQAENNAGFKSGSFLVLIAIYALLAIPFKSYAQPLIVMSVIPFSMVGAILGHIITGYDLSMLSIVGMMALLGVVVNDSLVLVDYINQQRARGIAVYEAVVNSGTARFRPVILTSLTTFAGLTPLLLENSTQSEFLKQMAISLGFGIVYATVITLIIVPINYLLAWQCKQKARQWLQQAAAYWRQADSGATS
ncbi:MAG: efflux RND transporter permease subunit [Gammaproteobacteria bacterium]|nr:efflux RND transporter permease subunit [Gammaproteobacteria bacterium]